MFQTIIVGVDGRPQDDEALALARRLADPDAQLVVASVFTIDVSMADTSALYFDAEHLRRVEQTAHEVARRCGGLQVRVVTAQGAGIGLQTIAGDVGADLIVIASSRRGLLGRVFAGEVARDVLRGSTCSVAIAPTGYAPQPGTIIRKIVVGHDRSVASDAALARAAELRDRDDCEMELVDVVEPFSSPLSAIAGTFVAGEVTTGSVAQELSRAAAGADLLAIGLQDRSLLDRMLVGSAAYALLRTQTVPLLVVPTDAGASAGAGDAAQRRTRKQAQKHAA